ncbi:MAG TPA: hypothetical protein VF707_08880 [Ardenticatenaceae bacterium]|jgi:hypothetical protein
MSEFIALLCYCWRGTYQVYSGYWQCGVAPCHDPALPLGPAFGQPYTFLNFPKDPPGLCQSGVGEGGEKGPHGPEASIGQ